MLVYGTLILILVIAFIASLAMRNPLRVDVIRDRGVLGREVAGGLIERVYRLQIINTSDSPLRLRLSAEGLPGLAVLAGQEASDVVEVEAAANKLVPMVIRVPAGGKPGAHPITLHARAQDGESRHRDRRTRQLLHSQLSAAWTRAWIKDLAMTTATIAKPWYREFWPWFLMAGPFLAMVGCFITIYFAFTQFSNQPIQEEGLVKRRLVIEQQGAGAARRAAAQSKT